MSTAEKRQKTSMKQVQKQGRRTKSPVPTIRVIISQRRPHTSLINVCRVRSVVIAITGERSIRITTLIVAGNWIGVADWRSTSIAARWRWAIATAMVAFVVVVTRMGRATTIPRVTAWAIIAWRGRFPTIVIATMCRRVATTPSRRRARAIAIVSWNFGLSLRARKWRRVR